MSAANNRLALVVVVLAAFIPLPFVLAREDLFIFLDSVAVSIGLGVIWAYSKGAFQWFWARKTTAGHLLVLGIVATWIALVGRLVWLWAWRIQDRPPDFFDHPIVALLLYFAIIGGSLHLLANRAIDDQIPPSGWATLVVTIAIGVALGVGLIAMT